MRRAASVILFVFGCWFLATEVMMGWLDLQQGLGAQLVGLGFIGGFTAIPLLLGTWTSPGNRFAELGLVLMIGAGVGGALALMLILATNEPAFQDAMRAQQGKALELHFAPLLGVINLVAIGGAGFALHRWATARARRDKPELEQVFD